MTGVRQNQAKEDEETEKKLARLASLHKTPKGGAAPRLAEERPSLASRPSSGDRQPTAMRVQGLTHFEVQTNIHESPSQPHDLARRASTHSCACRCRDEGGTSLCSTRPAVGGDGLN